MKTYRVFFEFDKENTRTLKVNSKSKEDIIEKVTGNNSWFECRDLKKDVFINLEKVTCFTINELS